MSPGYAYERAPDQEHFLNRKKTKELFRQVFPAELDYDELDRVHFPRVRSVIKMGPIPDDVRDDHEEIPP